MTPPEWWDLAEPPPREPRPSVLYPDAWSPVVRHSVERVQFLVTDVLETARRRRVDSGPYAVLPPGTQSSWVIVEGKANGWAGATTSLWIDSGFASDRDTEALESMGFALDSSNGYAHFRVTVSQEDPSEAFELVAAAATLACVGVYLPYWGEEWSQDGEWHLSWLG